MFYKRDLLERIYTLECSIFYINNLNMVGKDRTMNSYNIFNYKEMFSILMFMLVMIMITEKISPSYAVPINYNQLNGGHLYDNMKRHMDDNAFSNLSRNMTSTTNSIGTNFATGNINNNSPDNISAGGTSGNGFSSSIFTQHGSYSSNPHYHSSGRSSSIFTQHGYQLTVNELPFCHIFLLSLQWLDG
jgi:hypothetical protein